MIEPADFALTARAACDGRTVVALAGELDLYRAEALTDALQAAEGQVVVDLQEVTFLDSTTIALFVSEYRRRRAAGLDLTMLVGPRTPKTVFAITGIDRILAVRSAEAPPATDALAA